MSPTDDLDTWKEVKRRFEFFLILAALCGCGWLVWYDLLFLILMLIFGGIATTEAKLYTISLEKIQELEEELERVPAYQARDYIKQLNTVANILNDYAEIGNHPYIFDLLQDLENAKQNSQKYVDKWVQELSELERKRREKGVRYGCPPDKDTNICPEGFPIRATENTKDGYRGIYYEQDDKDYNSEAKWCFENVENAEKDNYRRSKRKQKPQS